MFRDEPLVPGRTGAFQDEQARPHGSARAHNPKGPTRWFREKLSGFRNGCAPRTLVEAPDSQGPHRSGAHATLDSAPLLKERDAAILAAPLIDYFAAGAAAAAGARLRVTLGAAAFLVAAAAGPLAVLRAFKLACSAVFASAA